MVTNCLIADDSRISRMMLRKIINTRHPDWIIVEAENGEQAIDEAKKTDFQLVILDFNMPVMSGGEAAEQIKQLRPQARIALLTANVQDSIKNLALKLGVDFIPKPITETKIHEYIG